MYAAGSSSKQVNTSGSDTVTVQLDASAQKQKLTQVRTRISEAKQRVQAHEATAQLNANAGSFERLNACTGQTLTSYMEGEVTQFLQGKLDIQVITVLNQAADSVSTLEQSFSARLQKNTAYVNDESVTTMDSQWSASQDAFKQKVEGQVLDQEGTLEYLGSFQKTLQANLVKVAPNGVPACPSQSQLISKFQNIFKSSEASFSDQIREYADLTSSISKITVALIEVRGSMCRHKTDNKETVAEQHIRLGGNYNGQFDTVMDQLLAPYSFHAPCAPCENICRHRKY